MCLAPITLTNEKEHWTNYGMGANRIVPCGKCYKCLRVRQHQWSFRLQKEAERSSSSAFMTLTYEEAPLSFNGHPTLEKSHLQKFVKRLRYYNNHKIKYYAVGEYGTKFLRPHYHLIAFNIDHNILSDPQLVGSKIWKKGIVDIDDVNIRTINYVTGYVMQGVYTPTQDDDDRNPHFATMSKNLGDNFLSPQMRRYYQNHKTTELTRAGGEIIPLPRYYREKIFDKPTLKTIGWENSIKLLEQKEEEDGCITVSRYHMDLHNHKMKQKTKRKKL